jgi:hypothetical protein
MFEKFEARLVADWRWVLRRSWSARLILGAAALSGAETVLPLYSDVIPHGPFAALSFLTTAAALVARFVAQSKED